MHHSSSDTPDGGPLAVIEYAAAGAAEAPDLRERVRRLTAQALDERRLSLDELRAVLGAIFDGVGRGVEARRGDLSADLKAAVAEVDEALTDATRAARHSFEAASTSAREFREGELADSLARLNTVRGEFAEALADTARRGSGRLSEEYHRLAEEFRANRSATREQLGATLGDLKHTLKTESRELAATLKHGAEVGKHRLADTAGGLLEALADKLKRESERLRR